MRVCAAHQTCLADWRKETGDMPRWKLDHLATPLALDLCVE